MSSTDDLQQAIDRFWETVPPVWKTVRAHLRSAAVQNFEITVEQFHVLRHIRRGYQSVGELAEARQISRSAISQAVDVLVWKELVTRSPQAKDRRCVRLELAPHASAVLEANSQEIRAWMRERMAALSGEELQNIQRAMETLKQTFAPEES